MIAYGFEENIDYITNRQKSPIANGGYKLTDDHIKITGWEIIDINRKLNFFNCLLIILIVLEVFQILLL